MLADKGKSLGYGESVSELLAKDPRTAWAWSEYLETRKPRRVKKEAAQQLLAAIPQGDHVEVFAEGAIFSRDEYNLADEMKRRSGRLAARTLRRWIVVREDAATADVLDGPGQGGIYREMPVSSHDISWWTKLDKGQVNVFVDDKAMVERIRRGAGFDIMRLPAWGDTPEPPLITESRGSVAVDSGTEASSLVTDWGAAERFALVHMKGMGFVGARLTGGVRDKGIDVAHPEAVAQVKMQGVPVGAPQIQQLRGARPGVANHLFYSTSGYTSAARSEAEESGVALFMIDAVGNVTAKGDLARQLVLDSRERQGGPESTVVGYVEGVEQRVRLALTNYGSKESAKYALKAAKEKEVVYRALGYLWTASDKLESAPEIGDVPLQSVVNYYRHTELLAAVYCRELGHDYPGIAILGKKTRSLDDFY